MFNGNNPLNNEENEKNDDETIEKDVEYES